MDTTIEESETTILSNNIGNFKQNKREVGHKRTDVTVRNLYELNRTRTIQNYHLPERILHKCNKEKRTKFEIPYVELERLHMVVFGSDTNARFCNARLNRNCSDAVAL